MMAKANMTTAFVREANPRYKDRRTSQRSRCIRCNSLIHPGESQRGSCTDIAGTLAYNNCIGAQGVSGSSGVATVRLLNEINFPARSTTKLDPTGAHLEIVDSGPLRQGTDITLTLVFAHAGKIKVLAQVSNPQTGNSGYFGP